MGSEATDAELVLAARFGEKPARRDAYSELVRRYEAMLRSMLRGLCGSEALADELAQESFLTGWLELGQLQDIARYGGWMKQIAYRKFLHAVRREKVERSYLDSLAADEGCQMWSGDLERILSFCNQDERELLLLTYGFGFTIDEIATARKTPPGTIKSTISRAKKSIREHMENEIKEQSYG